jgi:uncharacterized membrane protein YdfJ with MMPL/SSD domain
MSVGIGACLVAGLTFLPALISILGRFGWRVSEQRLGGGDALPAATAGTEGSTQVFFDDNQRNGNRQ